MGNTSPTLPDTVEIPIFGTAETVGTVNAPSTPVFYYSGITILWCWYLVPMELVEGYVNGLEMTAYDFGDGMAGVNFLFMNACGLFGSGNPGNSGGTVFNETEVNVIAYANARATDVPTGLTLADFVRGLDQTKNLGAYRLHIACDSPVAIAMGRALYFENKFFASYDFTAPNSNKPMQAQIDGREQWAIKAYDGPESKDPLIYSAQADLRGLTFLEVNASEIIDLSYDKTVNRPVGARRNFFGMHKSAVLEPDNDVVQVEVGPGTGDMSPDGRQMLEDMKRLVGDRKASAVQVFSSAPVIAEAVPYYVDLP